MSLFEVVRLWDAWTNIQDTQVLRDLFRQSSPRLQSSEISNLFFTPNHLFVTTSNQNIHEGLPSVCLYAFYCGPLHRTRVTSRDGHMTLPLAQQGSRVVEILDCSTENKQQIAVVQESGDFSVFDFNTERGRWIFRPQECLRLSPDKIVHSCALLGGCVVVYCEGVGGGEGGGEYGYQVSSRDFEHSSDGSVTLGPPTTLLIQCPAVHLRAFQGGVCLLPSKAPAPPNLLLFWFPGHSRTQPFIWNSPHLLPPLAPSSSYDFRTITLRLARQWSKAPQEPLLVAMATHPVTNQLLALSSDGGVHVIQHKSGKLARQQLTRLSDFTRRYPTAPSLSPGQLQLFTLHTYYGTCLKGELRLYDRSTGECVWECEDCEGSGTHLWTAPPHHCGVFSGSGVWVVRARKVADHAHFLAQSLFPVTTNADETTPGDCLSNGRLLAAELCSLWGMHLLATKYSVVAAHFTSRRTSGDNQPYLPHLPHEVKRNDCVLPPLMELITVLFNGSLQNPALMVALLADVSHPSYRSLLNEHISKFLKAYHGNHEAEADSKLLTPLNSETVPLLEHYQTLAEQYTHILDQQEDEGASFLPDVKHTVYDILVHTEQASFADVDINISLQSQFLSLSKSHPAETLSSIRDFLAVPSFKEAVEQLQSGCWHSERNWKSIFATESAPTLHRDPLALQGPTHHLPLFEVTCRLLYYTHPQELLDFVTFAQLARDYQASGDSAFARRCRKHFFYHRALDALPMFISLEATPTSPEAIQAYCRLLLQSDRANVEMTALQLLLSNQMWSDAVSLVEQIRNQEKASNHKSPQPEGAQCALFQYLLTHLAKANVFHEYFDRVWQLRPERFSVFDFLGVLRAARTQHRDAIPILVPRHSPNLTVSTIGPELLKLLGQVRTY